MHKFNLLSQLKDFLINHTPYYLHAIYLIVTIYIYHISAIILQIFRPPIHASHLHHASSENEKKKDTVRE